MHLLELQAHNVASNGAREMEFDLLDGGDVARDNAISLGEVSKIFEKQDVISLEWCHTVFIQIDAHALIDAHGLLYAQLPFIINLLAHKNR